MFQQQLYTLQRECHRHTGEDKVHMRVKYLKVISIQEEWKRPKYGALGNTRKYRCWWELSSINNNELYSVSEVYSQ